MVAEAEAVEGADKLSQRGHIKGATMNRMLSPNNARTIFIALLVLASSYASAAKVPARMQDSSTASAAPQQQKRFATPQLAAEALIQAADAYDVPTLMEIFGAEGKDLVASADPVRDRNIAKEFVRKAREKNRVTVEKGRATLLIGKEEWPMPIPVVMQQGKWHFDTKAGRTEVLARRIGANELDAIQICRGFGEAQMEYAASYHDGSPIHEYAKKIVSTPGKQDGLAWRNADNSPAGPIGEEIARAIAEGYSSKAAPYHGYYFKTLKGQGPNAPLGKHDYLVKGYMIGGFALMAVPAEYRVTGVKSFLVNTYGTVYEKDLGPDSVAIFEKTDQFDPDKTWKVTTVGK